MLGTLSLCDSPFGFPPTPSQVSPPDRDGHAASTSRGMASPLGKATKRVKPMGSQGVRTRAMVYLVDCSQAYFISCGPNLTATVAPFSFSSKFTEITSWGAASSPSKSRGVRLTHRTRPWEHVSTQLEWIPPVTSR